MRKAKIYKAQGIGKQEVESLLIEFSEEIPYAKDLKEAACIYRDEGKSLEFLLHHVLPGGTYGALLRKMLERRASLLAVSYGGLQDAGE